MRHEKVINRVYDPGRLREAWHQVKRNAGAAGIDEMSVDDFDERKDELLPIIHEKLKDENFRFKPVKRVLIPKGGQTKEARFVMNLAWFKKAGIVFPPCQETESS